MIAGGTASGLVMIAVASACAHGHVKGMISILKQFESCMRTKSFDEGLQKRQAGKLITSSLQEQHWNPHLEEMPATLVGWLPRWMKRESQEYKAANSS